MARAAAVFAGPTLTVEGDRQDYSEVCFITIGYWDAAIGVLVWTPPAMLQDRRHEEGQ